MRSEFLNEAAEGETGGVVDAAEHLVKRLEFQASACPPLYGALLQAAADDVRAGGPVLSVLEDKVGDPDGSALALRLMAAVHRLVLRGAAPELAAFYPSAGGDGVGPGAAEAFLATVAAHRDELREDSRRPLQTNEVGRAAALVGGFLVVAERFGLPLEVLEIGASAGLNLRWDHFLYEARGQTWGDPASPVRLCDFNSELVPPFHVDARVVARRGCDPNPLDPTTDEGRTLLLSFVWPDQIARLRLLSAALEVAQRVPAEVDAAPASKWLSERLPAREPGAATVVYHSIVLQYMDDAEQGAVAEAIASAGERATGAAPFAYLRMEPSEDMEDVEVRLTTWPGGAEELLARSGYHGTAIRWLGT